jgi:hypothetical protein
MLQLIKRLVKIQTLHPRSRKFVVCMFCPEVQLYCHYLGILSSYFLFHEVFMIYA